MKNLYRIGLFVAVCIVTGVLAIYFLDQFVIGIRDIGGGLPQVYENQAESWADQNLQSYALKSAEPFFGRESGGISQGSGVREDMAQNRADAQEQSEGSGIQAFGKDDTFDAQAVHTEGTDTVVTKTTVYEIEEYQRHTNEVNLVIERIPAQYIGMDRQELENALAIYLETPSLKDVERGLRDIRLVSFSPERITVRKSYEPELEFDYYYLTEEQGYVVVYFRNMGTLFCETGIELEELPDHLQQEIRHVKTIETEEELYGFLESYSS